MLRYSAKDLLKRLLDGSLPRLPDFVSLRCPGQGAFLCDEDDRFLGWHDNGGFVPLVRRLTGWAIPERLPLQGTRRHERHLVGCAFHSTR